jgi:hypothetical protein
LHSGAEQKTAPVILGETKPTTGEVQTKVAYEPGGVDSVLDSGMDVELQQPMSLESVWPVQRQRANNKLIQETLPGGELGTKLPTPLENKQDDLTSVLRAIPTEQPTTSPIEVLAPRRPRPALQRSQEQLPSSAQPLGAEGEPSSTSAILASGRTVEIPATLPSPSPAPQTTQVQRETSSGDSEHLKKPVSFGVETEIGILPADLWELVGTVPPTSAPNKPVMTHQPLHQPSHEPAKPPIQRTMGEAEAQQIGTPAVVTRVDGSEQEEFTVPPLPHLSMTKAIQSQPLTTPMQLSDLEAVTPLPIGVAPDDITSQPDSYIARHPANKQDRRQNEQESESVRHAISLAEALSPTTGKKGAAANTKANGQAIQRDIDTTTTERAPLPAPESGSNAPPTAVADAPTPPASIDIDELARRVYTNIKRSLLIEWERLSRR